LILFLPAKNQKGSNCLKKSLIAYDKVDNLNNCTYIGILLTLF
jgi:hypothetical protein